MTEKLQAYTGRRFSPDGTMHAIAVGGRGDPFDHDELLWSFSELSLQTLKAKLRQRQTFMGNSVADTNITASTAYKLINQDEFQNTVQAITSCTHLNLSASWFSYRAPRTTPRRLREPPACRWSLRCHECVRARSSTAERRYAGSNPNLARSAWIS